MARRRRPISDPEIVHQTKPMTITIQENKKPPPATSFTISSADYCLARNEEVAMLHNSQVNRKREAK
jgi:hypothetical protein